MSTNRVTIRQLRTDFRSVKRRIEEHGEVVITDHGEPAYSLKPLASTRNKNRPLPDYYARLLKRQPQRLSAQATREFWDEDRG